MFIEAVLPAARARLAVTRDDAPLIDAGALLSRNRDQPRSRLRFRGCTRRRRHQDGRGATGRPLPELWLFMVRSSMSFAIGRRIVQRATRCPSRLSCVQTLCAP
jgi:hypothetical protein